MTSVTAIPDLGFHPIDGARLLRSLGYSPVVCHMVAFHTAAEVEAGARDLGTDIFDELRLPDLTGLDKAADFPVVVRPVDGLALTVAS